MKQLFIVITCWLALSASAQIIDTTYCGSKIQTSLNMSELSNVINQLQSDWDELNAQQTSMNSTSGEGTIIQYGLCRIISSSASNQASYITTCVNDSIAVGWSPLGGLMLAGTHAAQVIVKYSN